MAEASTCELETTESEGGVTSRVYRYDWEQETKQKRRKRSSGTFRELGLFPRGPVPVVERGQRAKEASIRRAMALDLSRAFRELEMNENAVLIVWTKGQMRGVRAVIKRLGMV